MFVTFEGGEGVGKSVQIKMLSEHLLQQGLKVITTREPGGCPQAEAVRAVFLEHDLDVISEMLLIYAARREHVLRVIAPALAHGDIVLCDRFTDSSQVYQCGLEAQHHWLQQHAIDKLQPDFTFIYDLDPEIALSRRASRSNDNRFDRRALNFHQQVRKRYQAIAKTNDTRYHLINADANENTVFQRTLAAFMQCRAEYETS